MNDVYIKFGWIKLKQFAKITGISEDAVKMRMTNPKYPAFRLGAGLIKKLIDGYYIDYERYLEWTDNQKSVA